MLGDNVIGFATYFCKLVPIVALSVAISLHDPRLSPGHLEPLGSGRQKKPIEVATHYPEPEDFFDSYVDRRKPVLIKSAAKDYPAYTKWSDSYFKSLPELGTQRIMAAKRDKERKTTKHINLSVKRFLDKYKNEDLHVMENLPEPLKKDVLLPNVLRCEELKNKLEEVMLYMGTTIKRKLQSEDTDKIVCAIKGSIEILMLPYHKYKHKVKVGKMDKSYTKVDVDRVDFTKFPGLEDVEWTYASVDAGDCIFMPRKWIQQASLHPNENKETIAVSVLFRATRKLHPTDCDMEKYGTLDKVKFIQEEEEKMHAAEHEKHEKEHQEEHEREHKEEMERRKYEKQQNTPKSSSNDTKAGDYGIEYKEEHRHKHDHKHEPDENEEDEHEHKDDEEPDKAEGDMHSLHHFTKYLHFKPSKTVNIVQFRDLLKQDGNLTQQNHSGIEFPPSFDGIAKKIFDTLDANQDRQLTQDDFTLHITKPPVQLKETVRILSEQVYGFEDLVDELAMAKEEGITLEELRRRSKEEEEMDEHRAKLSVHDSAEF